MTKEPVFLNIYDILPMVNDVTSNVGLGVFHTGVEVYGTEYAFFGHESTTTGLFDMTPRNEEELIQEFKFREAICIGYTQYSEKKIKRILQKLEEEYPGNSYHLTNRNCNHFSNTFTNIICGEDIPLWVNRLAYVGSWFSWAIKPLVFMSQRYISKAATLQIK